MRLSSQSANGVLNNAVRKGPPLGFLRTWLFSDTRLSFAFLLTPYGPRSAFDWLAAKGSEKFQCSAIDRGSRPSGFDPSLGVWGWGLGSWRGVGHLEAPGSEDRRMAALGSPARTLRALLRELRCMNAATGRPYRDTAAYRYLVKAFRAHRVRKPSLRVLPRPFAGREGESGLSACISEAHPPAATCVQPTNRGLGRRLWPSPGA